MTNSARHLFNLLQSWTLKVNESPETVREDGNIGGRDFWTNHREAVLCLVDIERFLKGLIASGEDVDHYLETLPSWYMGVFAYNTPWRTPAKTATAPAVSISDFKLLRALAGHMDSVRWPARLQEPEQVTLKDALGAAKALADSSKDIGDDTRRYILALIAEAMEALQDFELFGATRIRSITMELGGAMQVVVLALGESPASTTWAEKAKAVLKATGSIGMQLAIGAASGVISGQITS